MEAADGYLPLLARYDEIQLESTPSANHRVRSLTDDGDKHVAFSLYSVIISNREVLCRRQVFMVRKVMDHLLRNSSSNFIPEGPNPTTRHLLSSKAIQDMLKETSIRLNQVTTAEQHLLRLISISNRTHTNKISMYISIYLSIYQYQWMNCNDHRIYSHLLFSLSRFLDHYFTHLSLIFTSRNEEIN